MEPAPSAAPDEAMTSLDRTILPRALALFIVSVAVTVVAEWAEPRLLSSSHVQLRYVGALAAGASAGGVGFAFIGLALAAAAAASLGVRRLMSRGVSRKTIRNSVIGAVVCLLLGLFVFLPFCLGSLPEGTYDCIPLAKRLYHSVLKSRRLWQPAA